MISIFWYSWIAQVDETICKFAKKGLTPSQIGVILRDSHGIAQVKAVTGNKILRILKAHGLAPEIPEDLYHLIKKAVSIRKHLERNRKDKDSKFRLILVESRIHRLARYYKKTKKLPPVWKYESTTASTLVAWRDYRQYYCSCAFCVLYFCMQMNCFHVILKFWNIWNSCLDSFDVSFDDGPCSFNWYTLFQSH